MADTPQDKESQTETKTDRHRRGSIVGPVILIGIGVVLLLNNLGMLPWGIWGAIGRAWPVILILVGLDILIGRRSVWGTIVMLIITVVILAAIVGVGLRPALSGGGAVHESFVQPSEEASRAEIRLNPGVASLDVAASSDASTLVEASVSHQKNELINRDYRLSDGTANFELDSDVRTWAPFIAPSEGKWDIKLGSAVPIALTVDSGVGRVDLDLRGLPISSLDLDAGVSATKIRLPDAGPMDVSIQGGVGSTTIVIPSTLSARIEGESGIGSLNVPGGYRKEGDNTYVSGSSESTDTANVKINVGVGSVNIEEGP